MLEEQRRWLNPAAAALRPSIGAAPVRPFPGRHPGAPSECQWYGSIFPRIARYLPAPVVLEIARKLNPNGVGFIHHLNLDPHQPRGFTFHCRRTLRSVLLFEPHKHPDDPTNMPARKGRAKCLAERRSSKKRSPAKRLFGRIHSHRDRPVHSRLETNSQSCSGRGRRKAGYSCDHAS